MTGLPDPAWTAFQLGLKPALRLSMPPERASAFAEKLGGLALAVEVSKRPVKLDSGLALLVYVARTQARASALVSAEERTLPAPDASDDAARRAAHRDLGALLGYPSCCIDAFIEQERSPDSELADDFLYARGALARTAGPPHRWLNPLIEGPRARLIEHYPCRYDCRPSLAYAGRVAAELARLAPEPFEELDRRLACRVSIRPDGSRSDVGDLPEGLIVDFRTPAGRAPEGG